MRGVVYRKGRESPSCGGSERNRIRKKRKSLSVVNAHGEEVWRVHRKKKGKTQRKFRVEESVADVVRIGSFVEVEEETRRWVMLDRRGSGTGK
jgi:hypothetical protein